MAFGLKSFTFRPFNLMLFGCNHSGIWPYGIQPIFSLIASGFYHLGIGLMAFCFYHSGTWPLAFVFSQLGVHNYGIRCYNSGIWLYVIRPVQLRNSTFGPYLQLYGFMAFFLMVFSHIASVLIAVGCFHSVIRTNGIRPLHFVHSTLFYSAYGIQPYGCRSLPFKS